MSPKNYPYGFFCPLNFVWPFIGPSRAPSHWPMKEKLHEYTIPKDDDNKNDSDDLIISAKMTTWRGYYLKRRQRSGGERQSKKERKKGEKNGKRKERKKKERKKEEWKKRRVKGKTEKRGKKRRTEESKRNGRKKEKREKRTTELSHNIEFVQDWNENFKPSNQPINSHEFRAHQWGPIQYLARSCYISPYSEELHLPVILFL